MIHPSRLLLCVLAPALALAEEEGFVPLFDGRSKEGWTVVGGPDHWVVEEGKLVTQGQGGGWISTETTYGDFILRFEYRTEPGGNSGVYLRAPHEGNPSYTGMEVQILDDDAPEYAELQPFQYNGSIYGVVAATRGQHHPPGQWNAMEIEARGSRITVVLNGQTIVDADLSDHAEKAEEHPGILREEGYLGFQSYGRPGRVEFRDIRLKALD